MEKDFEDPISGNPLKRARERIGWSQARLAEALGVSVRSISRWEQGEVVPYPYYREQLRRFFQQHTYEAGTTGLQKPLTPQSLDASIMTIQVDPLIPYALLSRHPLLERDALLQQVKACLCGERPAPVALYGLPGVGKTSFVVALVSDEQVQQRFPDGVLWVGFGPETKLVNLLTRWGKQLGLDEEMVKSPENWKAWLQALHSVIGKRRMLLIFDDVWDAETALTLSRPVGQSAYILTTRQPQVAHLFARENKFLVEELTESAGMALMRYFVPNLLAEHNSVLRAIVKRVGGLPQALVLAGRYLALQSLSGQRRRLRAAFERLAIPEQMLTLDVPGLPEERPYGFSPEQKVTLQAAIELSVQQLSQRARQTLFALTLFPGKPNSFSEEAALWVSGASTDELDELWDAGLLQLDGERRYYIQKTIVDYGRMQHIDAYVYERLSSWARHEIREHRYEPHTLRQEMPNLQAALRGS